MFKTLKEAFKIKEVRKKILITLLLLLIYRIGCWLPTPGLAISTFQSSVTSGGDFLSVISAVSGNALTNGALLALGVVPYINASIIIQLLNGVLFVKLKPGQSIDGVVRQYNSGAAIAGDFELLNLQIRLINEISGVNSAMQGQAPKAGTPASLYAQQVQNSSLNLKGLFDSFKMFRRRRDSKVMKTVQQYYTESRYIDIAGTEYSEEAKWYDPSKVQ